MVLVADRDTARRDDQVAAAGKLREGSGNQLRVVPHDSPVDDVCPRLARKRKDHRAVGIEERGFSQPLPLGAKLAARREDADPHLASYARPFETLRGEQRDMTRIDALARLEQYLPDLDILTAPTDVVTGSGHLGQDDPATDIGDVLLHHHGIGTMRDPPARENPHGTIWRDRCQFIACCDASCESEGRSRRQPVTYRKGVAVHGGLVECR
jgi:hypothetical protein